MDAASQRRQGCTGMGAREGAHSRQMRSPPQCQALGEGHWEMSGDICGGLTGGLLLASSGRGWGSCSTPHSAWDSRPQKMSAVPRGDPGLGTEPDLPASPIRQESRMLGWCCPSPQTNSPTREAQGSRQPWRQGTAGRGQVGHVARRESHKGLLRATATGGGEEAAASSLALGLQR